MSSTSIQNHYGILSASGVVALPATTGRASEVVYAIDRMVPMRTDSGCQSSMPIGAPTISESERARIETAVAKAIANGGAYSDQAIVIKAPDAENSSFECRVLNSIDQFEKRIIEVSCRLLGKIQSECMRILTNLTKR